jgi:hypothetical protein
MLPVEVECMICDSTVYTSCLWNETVLSLFHGAALVITVETTRQFVIVNCIRRDALMALDATKASWNLITWLTCQLRLSYLQKYVVFVFDFRLTPL